MVLASLLMLSLPAIAAAAGPRHALDGPRRGVTEEHVHLKRGDTLGSLLAARGVGATEAHPWIRAAAKVFDLRRLSPRRGLTFRFHPKTRALMAIRYEIDDRTLLTVERTDEGIRAQRASLPYFIEVKGAAGIVVRNLYEDARAAGIPPSVVGELLDIYAWEIDLERQLQPGDEFRVLYENIWLTGAAHPEPGKVIGAELSTTAGRTTAVLFEDRDGHGGYYRPSGEPFSGEFLRAPVEYSRISSGFTSHRRHPVLRVDRPHRAVDLVAPTGAPVRAVGAGRIEFAGWRSRLGRSVRVGHEGQIDSTYGHLSRLAAGVRRGAQVRRGQVIGYVGRSGLATGPHLHFEMRENGRYVNPLARTAASSPPIAETERHRFDRVRLAVTRHLTALPTTDDAVTLSLSMAGVLGE